MSKSEFVFLLEEPSAEAMLMSLLPRFIPASIVIRFIVFEGKTDLEKNLAGKLRGYRNPNARFVILRDQDSGDCKTVKSNLVEKCKQAGKDQFLVRIACHEIESWYLADLDAVEKALKIPNLSGHQNRSKYRNPDDLANAAQELSRITNDKYQKISGSRAIGPHLDTANQRSRSFAVFVSGLHKLVANMT